MSISKKTLISFLEEKKYAGALNATEVKSFLEGINTELHDGDKLADIEAILSEVDAVKEIVDISEKKVTVVADAGEEIEIVQANADPEMETEAAKKQEIKKEVSKVEVKEVKAEVKVVEKIEKKNVSESKIQRINNMVNNKGSFSSHVGKIYDAKAARGETVYSSADEAALAGHAMRLATFGAKDYPLRALDMEVCEKADLGVSASNPTVPTIVADYIENKLAKHGAVRKLLGANFKQMNSNLFNLTRLDTDAVVMGGAENAAAGDTNASTPGGTSIPMIAVKMMGTKAVSNEVFQDSVVNIGETLTNIFINAIAYREDYCYFLGDGTSTTSLGFYGLNQSAANGGIGSAGIVTATGGWSTVTQANVDALKGKVKSGYDVRNFRFACSQQFYFTVLYPLLRASSGVSLTEATMGAKIASGGEFDAMFDGYGVTFVHAMPSSTALAQHCLYFGDFSCFAAGVVRNSYEIENNPHVGFNTDTIYWRGKSRYAQKNIGNATDSTGVIGGLAAIKTSASVT